MTANQKNTISLVVLVGLVLVLFVYQYYDFYKRPYPQLDGRLLFIRDSGSTVHLYTQAVSMGSLFGRIEIGIIESKSDLPFPERHTSIVMLVGPESVMFLTAIDLTAIECGGGGFQDTVFYGEYEPNRKTRWSEIRSGSLEIHSFDDDKLEFSLDVPVVLDGDKGRLVGENLTVRILE